MTYRFQAIYLRNSPQFVVRGATLAEARVRARTVAPHALAIVLRGKERQT